jgi:hypothetical protein
MSDRLTEFAGPLLHSKCITGTSRWTGPKINVDRRIDMNIITSSRVRRVAAGAVLVAAPAVIALAAPAVSNAGTAPGIGCETVHWGFLGLERRKVCDGPTQADGSWQRTRTIWHPGYFQPLRCDSAVFFTCTGGHYVPENLEAQETYTVTPSTVLPDEPGWLPAGTDNIL